MYILNEDYDYFEQLSNGLGHGKSHDFIDLLLSACRQKSGAVAFIINSRNQKELDALAPDPKMMITREMIDEAYRKVKEEQ